MSALALNLKPFSQCRPKLAPRHLGRLPEMPWGVGDYSAEDRCSRLVPTGCNAVSLSKQARLGVHLIEGKHLIIKRLRRVLVPVGLAAWVSLGASPAGATAIAHSDLAFHDLAITPAAGTVQFTGPWLLQAQASANNSLGEFDSDYAEKDGPATVGVSAVVTWARSRGMTSSADADGNIPGKTPGSAIAQGRGTDRRDSQDPPMRFFQILGGTAGNPVSVTFDVLIDYSLHVQTDKYGELAEAEAIFGQEIFGQDIGFVSVNSFSQILTVGPNGFGQDSAVNQLLSNTIELQYGAVYTMLNEADAEIRVSNVPEPSTLWLLTFGLLTLAVPLLARKNRRM